MSDSGVISDVTNTLQELLKNQQRPKGQFEISLSSPAEEDVTPNMKPKVNLFLFRVVENPFVKNQEWLPVGTDTLTYPPLALDLFYVLTPFAPNKLDEHRVLGEAMRILHDFAIITPPDMQGNLAHGVDEIKVDLWQLTVEDLARIWSALTKPYRLSIGYAVRTLLIDSAIEQGVQRVLEVQQQFVQIK